MRKDLDIRKYEINGLFIECEVSCNECPFYKKCLEIDKENLRYKVDLKFFGSELHRKATILPKIETDSISRARKLYYLLIELIIKNDANSRCHALYLAKNLNISVYRVRKRIEYLVNHHYIKEDDDKLTFSFSRTVHSLVKFYIYEFKLRFGQNPHITSEDLGALQSLIKEYSESDLKSYICKYLDLKDNFVSSTGRSLKFFPMKLNAILSSKYKNQAKPISKEQLNEYVKGKKEGRWTGQEEWAKIYELALNEQN